MEAAASRVLNLTRSCCGCWPQPLPTLNKKETEASPTRVNNHKPVSGSGERIQLPPPADWGSGAVGSVPAVGSSAPGAPLWLSFL